MVNLPQEDLTASQVAQLIGVAVTTLRTWDRRYGLGPRSHHAGKHRRYRPQDVQRLMEMQRLTAQGVPPAQAAAWVLDRATPANPRDGGGHAVAVGTSGPAVRGLTRAAMRLDAAECRRLIIDAIVTDGVVPAWTNLLAPALIHIGDKHAATRAIIEVEHLLSAALAEHRMASRLLGARVPPTALREAIRRAGPDIVVVWSQTADTANLSQLTEMITTRPIPKLVIAAGPGWADGRLPDGMVRPVSLAEAVSVAIGA